MDVLVALKPGALMTAGMSRPLAARLIGLSLADAVMGALITSPLSRAATASDTRIRLLIAHPLRNETAYLLSRIVISAGRICVIPAQRRSVCCWSWPPLLLPWSAYSRMDRDNGQCTLDTSISRSPRKKAKEDHAWGRTFSAR